MATEIEKPNFALVATELIDSVIGQARDSLASFDNVVEEHLQRIDEISTLVDSLRLEIQQTTDEGYPALLQSCAELQQLYAIIDTVEAAVDRSAAAASIAEERLNVLQQGFNARYGESGSLAKLTSLFKKTPGATDAPVKLPPYDPSSARLDVSSELSALREVIGDVAPEVQETGAGEEDSGQQGAVDSEAAGSDAPE